MYGNRFVSLVPAKLIVDCDVINLGSSFMMNGMVVCIDESGQVASL